jgi:hypothetical protein
MHERIKNYRYKEKSEDSRCFLETSFRTENQVNLLEEVHFL